MLCAGGNWSAPTLTNKTSSLVPLLAPIRVEVLFFQDFPVRVFIFIVVLECCSEEREISYFNSAFLKI